MSDLWRGRLLGVYYDTHPHWVVDRACYAVTLRCHGSLPRAAQSQLREIGASLRKIDPASDEAKAYQRRQFAIIEHGLDRASGFRPFAAPQAALAMMDFLEDHHFDGLSLDHWVVMSNHLHVVTSPFHCRDVDDFRAAWGRFKSRSARVVNHAIGREGKFWQTSWYDRWIRSPEEYHNRLEYMAQNPVKAGLCERAEDFPYRKESGGPPSL